MYRQAQLLLGYLQKLKNNLKNFIGDLFSVGISKIVVIVFGLGYTVITARYLGPELNGVIAALMVYPSLFMTLGSLGIRQATAFYIGKEIYSEASIKRAVIHLWYISTLFCLVSSYALIKFFSNIDDNETLIYLAIAPIPFTLFITYNSGVFLGKNEIKEFNKVNWIPAVLKFFSVVLLVVIFSYSITGAMVAAIISPFLMSLILLKKNEFFKAFSLSVEWQVLKPLFSLGIIYAAALMIISLNYKVDIIILNKLSTDFETGIYSKGAQLIEYLWQIPMMLSTIVFARSASTSDNHAFSLKVTQLLRISLIVLGGTSIILAIFSDLLIDLLFGVEFKGSARVLLFLLPGVVLLTIFKVLNMDLAGRGKPWVSMKAMIPALFVNVILNIMFIPKYGAVGAAVTSSISYSIAALIFLHFYSVQTKIPIRSVLSYSKQDFQSILNYSKKLFKK